MSHDYPTRSFRYCPSCGQQKGGSPSIKHFACPDCGYQFYTNAAAAVAAFLRNEKGEFLFVRRAREPARGKLNVPGGFVDPLESVEEALLREVDEEVGIAIENYSLLGSFPNTYTYRDVTYHTVDLFFLCTARHLEARLEAEEVTQTLWIAPETVSLEEIAFDSTKSALQAYRRHCGFP